MDTNMTTNQKASQCRAIDVEAKHFYFLPSHENMQVLTDSFSFVSTSRRIRTC
ncbi:unnamed protein product [Staurois parvus]|uniref:Uncharacterized protein n=1 Tax=Staurois parvus TaxID=386267 RepID=A0ABN9BXX7_9NEOB|nr:unnamed protein product [Staurois parvus]